MKSVTVIVPVRNESRAIARTLERLCQQNCPPGSVEILVIDGRSTDDTRQIVLKMAKSDNRIRLIDNPLRWSSAARNLGIRESRGEVVLVVDGHCEIPDSNYLARVSQAFEQSGADCLGRPQPLDVSRATPLQEAIAAARNSPLGHHPDSHIYSKEPGFVPAHSVAVAYRRDVFDRVGMFDESFDACEDVELNHRVDRAGLRCFFTPEILIRYEPRNSLRGLFRQLVRYGRGRVRLARKHPDTLSPKTLVPALFVAGLPAGLALAFVSKWLGWIYVTTLVLYTIIVLVSSVAAARSMKQKKAIPALPLIFLMIHLASGAGQWMEFLKPVRKNPFAG
jgi:succinoglycan biosynthesis protein ExoA